VSSVARKRILACAELGTRCVLNDQRGHVNARGGSRHSVKGALNGWKKAGGGRPPERGNQCKGGASTLIKGGGSQRKSLQAKEKSTDVKTGVGEKKRKIVCGEQLLAAWGLVNPYFLNQREKGRNRQWDKQFRCWGGDDIFPGTCAKKGNKRKEDEEGERRSPLQKHHAEKKRRTTSGGAHHAREMKDPYLGTGKKEKAPREHSR